MPAHKPGLEKAAAHLRERAAKQEALEHALTEWGESQRANNATRDDLVKSAVEAGISKHRVYVLTGIARTTIDDILKREQR